MSDIICSMRTIKHEQQSQSFYLPMRSTWKEVNLVARQLASPKTYNRAKFKIQNNSG